MSVLFGLTRTIDDLIGQGWCPWCTHSIEEPEPDNCLCCSNKEPYKGAHGSKTGGRLVELKDDEV